MEAAPSPSQLASSALRGKGRRGARASPLRSGAAALAKQEAGLTFKPQLADPSLEQHCPKGLPATTNRSTDVLPDLTDTSHTGLRSA